ncbi:MAG: prephenate dehydrogenase [Ferruginibacter sp.]
MTITIIGLGLIGGSMALILKEKQFAEVVLGFDNNHSHCERALELNLVDRIVSPEEAIPQSDLVILAVPVDQSAILLPKLLSLVKSQVIMDVGSAKEIICKSVISHSNRGRFVATHPMWGTEHSGPDAALRSAFQNKAAVICERNKSDEDSVLMVEKVYSLLGMHLVYMNASDHDIHTAYISHVSHITSFALANTVLEKEKEDNTIFELASGGFESTVRLAKSSAAMWAPIFEQNRNNVLDVLNEHISQLKKFKACLEKENYAYLSELIHNANTIKRILK